jgi:hypothetical protein
MASPENFTCPARLLRGEQWWRLLERKHGAVCAVFLFCSLHSDAGIRLQPGNFKIVRFSGYFIAFFFFTLLFFIYLPFFYSDQFRSIVP